MARTVGKAYVQIIPSAKGIKAGLGKAISPDANNAGLMAGNGIVGKMKGVIAKAAIGAAIVAGIKKSVSEGAALEQSMGGIETLFKKNANTVIKNASNAYKTAGMSANEYMENVTSFSAGLIKSVGGDTAKAAKTADMAMTDMSDNANKMGTNMEDIKNAYQGFAKQNYTMLDNLKLGYGGTKGEMQRLLADAEKLTGKKYDINNLDDVYNAIHAIQTDIGITGTTAKEAEHTISGSFNSMKAAATDFMGQLAIGGDVKKPLKNMVQSAGTFLFGNLLPMIGNIVKAIPDVVMTGIDVIGPEILPAAEKLVSFLGDAIKQAWDMAPGLLDGLISAIQSQAPLIAAKLKTQFSGMMKTVIQNMPAVLEQLKSMAKKMIDAFIAALPGLISGLADVISGIASFLSANMPAIVAAGADIVVYLVKGLLKNSPAIIAAILKLLAAIVKAMISGYATCMKCGIEIVKSIAKGLGGAALSAIKKAGTKIIQALVKSIMKGITSIRKIIKTIADIIKKLPDNIKGAINKVKSLLSFSGLLGKVKGIWNRIKSAITGPINSAKNTVSRIINSIKGFFPISVGKIIGGIKLPTVDVGITTKKVLGQSVKLPSFKISWAAKGGIVDGATLIGAGEKGKEAIVPLKPFWAKLDKMNTGNKTVYNIGDVTLDVHDLEDVLTLEDFVEVIRRAKAFA